MWRKNIDLFLHRVAYDSLQIVGKRKFIFQNANKTVIIVGRVNKTNMIKAILIRKIMHSIYFRLIVVDTIV